VIAGCFGFGGGRGFSRRCHSIFSSGRWRPAVAAISTSIWNSLSMSAS